MGETVEALRGWVPRWWRGEAGAAGAALNSLLLPMEGAYRAAVALRSGAYDHRIARVERVEIPVVSIGNLAVGGVGKTPVTAWIAGRLRSTGARPAVVLRGYGADEILVHRELNPDVPVMVARRRVEGVRRAVGAGCDVAILDDAFQHRALARDLDVVLVAAESWTSVPRLLPRGPWREPPGALRRADLVVVTRKSATLERAAAVAAELERLVPGERVLRCHLEPGALWPLHDGTSIPLERFREREVLAVAALAEPEPFARNLSDAGARVQLVRYPDHHPYSAEDAERITQIAGRRPIVMTRKDAVKLRSLLPATSAAYYLDQRVEFEVGLTTLQAALRRVVSR